MSPDPPTTSQISEQDIDQFIKQLQETGASGQPMMADQIVRQLAPLTESIDGLRLLYKKAAELAEAGLFEGKVWEDPTKLVPALVSGTLIADPPKNIFEIISDLRMLAYAEGKTTSDRVSQKEALDFIEQVIVGNLNYMFLESEEMDDKHRKACNLMHLIRKEIDFEQLKDQLAEEIYQISAQRPIVVNRIKDILKLIKEELDLEKSNTETDQELKYYLNVLKAPTHQSEKHSSLDGYQNFLHGAPQQTLKKEADQLAHCLNKTGLVSPYHAIFINYMNKEAPALLANAFGVSTIGQLELKEHRELIQKLIRFALSPATAQMIYGFGSVLEHGILSEEPVRKGISKLLSLDLHPEVEKKVVKSEYADGEEDPHALLVAGTLSLLGQPLGIGQGHNPTCQSARGLSLWSQHARGRLINMIITAAQTNDLEHHFEGDVLRASQLPLGLSKELYTNLDPVSILLVPHLDKIYNEMMRRVQHRGEDGHKWVNPAFYGHWIPTGFLSAFDQVTYQLKDYEKFIRTFYATQHPLYNGGHDIVFPNPLGIVITSSYGELAGYHAISLLRVDKSPQGKWRAYFLNPQNEGRVNWGQEIRPTVEGHGERHGESSLPFAQFASRVYAYHFNSLELGDISKVESKEIEKVKTLVHESWGEDKTSGIFG